MTITDRDFYLAFVALLFIFGALLCCAGMYLGLESFGKWLERRRLKGKP